MPRFAAGDYVSAVALGSSDDIALNVLFDNVSTITAEDTLIRVINASDEELSASLANGTIVANNLAAGSVGGTTNTSPWCHESDHFVGWRRHGNFARAEFLWWRIL